MSDSNQPATRGDLEALATTIIAASDERTTAAIAASEERTTAAIAASEERTTAAIAASEERTTAAIAASEDRTSKEIAAAAAHTARVVLEHTTREIAAATNVVIEHNREMFRIATDQAAAVADRTSELEARVVEHVADDTRHRVPRGRRR